MRSALAALAAILIAAWPVLAPLLAGYSVDPAGTWWQRQPFKAHEPAAPPPNWALHDRGASYAPWMRVAAARAGASELPAWNPAIHLGVPFAANPQTAILYPPQWVFCALAPGPAWELYFTLHAVVVSLGMFGLARELGVSRLAAACAAVACAHSGFVQVWAGTNTGAAASWGPALFWATESLKARPSRGSLAALVTVASLLILAGSPQIAVVALLAALGSALVRPAHAGRVIGALVCAVLLTAPHTLPGLGYVRDSHAYIERVGRTVNEHTLPMSAAAHLVCARVFGFPPGRYDGQLAFAAQIGPFAGGLMAALAVVGAVCTRGSGALVLVWCTAAVLTFGLAGTPRLVAVVPMVGGVRLYYAALLLAGATALLGARGLDTALGADGTARRRTGWVLALIALGLVAPGAAAKVAPQSARRALDAIVDASLARTGQVELPPAEIHARAVRLLEPKTGLAALALVGAGVGLLALVLGLVRRVPGARALVLALVALEGGATWSGFHAVPRLDPTAAPPGVLARVRELAGHERTLGIGDFSPNLAGVFGFREVRGYDALMPASFQRYLSRVDPRHAGIFENLDLDAVESPLLDEASVAIVWAPESWRAPAGLERVELRDGAVIWRRPRALPRARIAGATRVVVDDGAALDALAAGGRVAGQDVVWVPPAGGVVPRGGSGSCAIESDLPERVVVRARVLGEVWLVLADQWMAGWSCAVDGRNAPIERVNVCMRGVVLGAGEHTVEFRYVTPGVGAGLALALVGGVLVLALAFTGASGRTS